MGTKRDKRRKKKGHTALGAKKTEAKAEKNEEKRTRRVQAKLDKDEDDIDALLAAIELEEAQRLKIEVLENCKPPPPRVHASYTPVQLEVWTLLPSTKLKDNVSWPYAVYRASNSQHDCK